MAEHRAAVNALHALFLVRAPNLGPSIGSVGSSVGGSTRSGEGSTGSLGGTGEERGRRGMILPTEAHDVWAIEGGKVSRGLEYTGAAGWAGSEVLVESARR